VVVALLAAFPAVRLVQLLAGGGTSPYPTTYPDTPTYRARGSWLDFSLTSLSGRSVRPWGVTAWMALWPSDLALVIAQVVLSTVAWAALAVTLASVVRRVAVRRALVLAVLVLACTAQVANWDLVVLGESVSISSGVLALAALVRFTAAPSGLRAAVLLAFALWFTMTRPNVFVVLLGWAVALALPAFVRRGRGPARPVRPYAVVAGVLVLFSVYSYVYNVRSDVTWHERLGYSRTTVAYGYPVSANDPVARQVIADLRRSSAPACMIPSAPNVVSDHGTTAWVARTVRACPQMDAWATAHWNRWWAGWLLGHPGPALRIVGTELPSSLTTPVWGPITSAVPSSVSALFFGSEPQPQSAVAAHSFRTQPLILWLAAVLVLGALGRRRGAVQRPQRLHTVRWGLAGAVVGGLGSAVSSGLLIQTAPFEVGQESAAAAVLVTVSLVALTAVGVERLLAPAYAGAVDHDATYWDERYAKHDGERHEHSLAGGPDPTLVEVVSALPPGRALDVAAGLGRHALWLAEQGWDVTAVDFSAVAIDAGRAHEEPGHTPIEWVVADAREWEPAPGRAPYDVVLCSFFHLEDEVYGRVRQWLAPGGRLVVLGHALRNLTDGVGGPTNPAYLHTEERLRAVADGLEVERLAEVVRVTPAGNQIDLVLVARRP
jgi:SAM-dependent methyltransferase